MFKVFKSMLAMLCAMLLAAAAFTAGAESDAETYRIEVDITNQITTVYTSADRAIVRQMLCSTGRYDSTPLGTMKLEASRANDRSEWYYIDKYKCYVKYPTRIQGPILFHSLPYLGMDMARIDEQSVQELGTRASHGCIRMNWQDAKWIAENCPDGTTVSIFFGAARKDALRAALKSHSFSADEGESYAQFAADANAMNTSTFGLGVSGEGVAALQESLTALGYMRGEVTGTYDGDTMAAVIRYQLAAGLSATGNADAALRDRISEDAEAR